MDYWKYIEWVEQNQDLFNKIKEELQACPYPMVIAKKLNQEPELIRDVIGHLKNPVRAAANRYLAN